MGRSRHSSASSSSSDEEGNPETYERHNPEIQTEGSAKNGGRVPIEKINKVDSFYMETAGVNSGRGHSAMQAIGWIDTFKLAFQSIGVVYGDIGTSPLYAIPGIFPNGIQDKDDVLGALSLIFYSIVIVLLMKYVIIVLAANDNGDGGSFALYSLICRYAKVSFMPNQQVEDKDVSTYHLEVPNRRLARASALKSFLETNMRAKYFLLFLTMLGTAMVLGDGILTPCISVLSAVGGIKLASSALNDDAIMWISVVILILLFLVQRFGTEKVGYTFAPILTVWFVSIALIGIYNFIKYDPGVIKAVNPVYIITYFQRNKTNAWISLGGVFLCLTGSEALFADLGHFSVGAIRISSCGIVFPSILLAYFGQASYLRKRSEDVTTVFYSSVPNVVYWPMFVVAVLASIIASQALISASFSIIKQSMALGCFPRVKVVHTTPKLEGQIYIPEINNFLMLACVAVTLGFKTTIRIGNAYGIAVALVFTITTFFLIIIMIMIWKINIFLVIAYALTIGLVELVFLSSVLYKFVDGGYLPLIFAALMVTIMFIWNYGYRKKYNYELENKVSPEALSALTSGTKIQRIPGLALFYSELVQGISPIFAQYVDNIPALHSVLVFVSIKSMTISKVPIEERFLFRRIDSQEFSIYRCIVRYGYTDARMEHQQFEGMLVERLKAFVLDDLLKNSKSPRSSSASTDVMAVNEEEVRKEAALVDVAVREGGIVYLMGQSEVTSNSADLWKKVAINYGFNWIMRFVRQQEEVFSIPRKRLIKVAITFEVK